MKTRLSLLTATALMFLSVAAFAKEVGTVRTKVDLMAAPYTDAKSAGTLSANTQVDVLQRRGAWVQIAAAEKKGWVKLYQVRIGDGPQKQGSSGLSELWNAGQTGRSGTQGIVATTGIRGMTADELKNAKPDPKEVEKLEQYRANDTQAREQAAAAGLKEQKVPSMPKQESTPQNAEPQS